MHGVHVLNEQTIEEAQHHCCSLLIIPVSLANHDTINARFLLRTSKCDSEFEGGETKSHAEELQAVCVDTARQTGSTGPGLREAVLVSPPRRQEARREGAAFPGGGRPALPQPAADPGQQRLSAAGAGGGEETALFCWEPLPGTHRPTATTRKTLDRPSSGASDSRPDLCSSEPPRSSETGRV